jgi:hypothetical protein
MRIAIFVYETATLIFKTVPAANLEVRLQKLGGDAPLVAAKMPVKPGIYKIEAGTRVVPEADARIEVLVDRDVMPPESDPKDPFPPKLSGRAIQLAAAFAIQGFYANTLGDTSFGADEVDLSE